MPSLDIAEEKLGVNSIMYRVPTAMTFVHHPKAPSGSFYGRTGGDARVNMSQDLHAGNSACMGQIIQLLVRGASSCHAEFK